jgi:trans-aconitate methyltransferase
MTTTWNAKNYDTSHAYVWTLAADLLDLLDPHPDERILDIGSGTGHLTTQIAQRGAKVIGLDASPEMVARAKLNYPDLDFRVASAADFTVDQPADAIFSNATLHWVKDAQGAAHAIHRALRPGGRFVAEFGGAGNVQTITRAIATALKSVNAPSSEQLSPWYYPTIAQYTAILERADLEPTFAQLFNRPTPLEAGLKNWIEQYCTTFLNTIPPEKRAQFLSLIEESARPHLFKDNQWTADYRRLRIVAIRPA